MLENMHSWVFGVCCILVLGLGADKPGLRKDRAGGCGGVEPGDLWSWKRDIHQGE